VTIGRIAKAHGIRGEVTVEPWVEVGDALSPGSLLWLTWPKGEGREECVETVRPHGTRWLIRLKGFSDRDQAETLVRAEIRVDRDVLPPLGQDEYLWEDLIGLEVVEESGKPVGKLVEVFATGSHGENDVIVVQDEDGEEVLLPMTRQVILNVDLEGGQVKVSIPKGLQEPKGEGVDL
jgi:16S rRNA processing protein RimM